MQHLKKVISLLLIAVVSVSALAFGSIGASASGTGIGLAEWSLNAYYSGWSYVWGGCSPGAVDCSGLIYSYAGGYRNNFEPYTDYIGEVSNGIPNIHGLGLGTPSHYGVYVGNGMAVDARGRDYGVVYSSVYSRTWNQYFKIPGVSYPTTGWETFNGEYFYYENGQYLANTSRTINGVTYTFASSGASDKTPGDMSATAGSNSSSGSSSNSSSSSDSSSSILKLGSSGDAVVKLQNRLAELGFYTGDIDGSFGNGTQAAYIAFQKAAGVTVDGIAGPSDATILYSDSAPKAQSSQPTTTTPAITEPQTDPVTEVEIKTFRLGDVSSDIVSIQSRLSDLGYYTGECDGNFGEATDKALRAFESANTIYVDGIADEDTLAYLNSENAIAYTEPETEAETEEETEAETALETEAQSSVSKVTTNSTTSPYSTSATTASVEVTSEIVMQTTNFSAKALNSLTSGTEVIALKAPANNIDFIKWFIVVFLTIGISFIIVLISEKAGEKKRKQARRAYKSRHTR